MELSEKIKLLGNTAFAVYQMIKDPDAKERVRALRDDLDALRVQTTDLVIANKQQGAEIYDLKKKNEKLQLKITELSAEHERKLHDVIQERDALSAENIRFRNEADKPVPTSGRRLTRC